MKLYKKYALLPLQTQLFEFSQSLLVNIIIHMHNLHSYYHHAHLILISVSVNTVYSYTINNIC